MATTARMFLAAMMETTRVVLVRLVVQRTVLTTMIIGIIIAMKTLMMTIKTTLTIKPKVTTVIQRITIVAVVVAKVMLDATGVEAGPLPAAWTRADFGLVLHLRAQSPPLIALTTGSP